MNSNQIWISCKDNPWRRATGHATSPTYEHCVNQSNRFDKWQRQWKKDKAALFRTETKLRHAQKLLPVVEEFVPHLEDTIVKIQSSLRENQTALNNIRELRRGDGHSQHQNSSSTTTLQQQRQCLNSQYSLTHQHLHRYKSQRPLLRKQSINLPLTQTRLTQNIHRLQRNMDESISDSRVYNKLKIDCRQA